MSEQFLDIKGLKKFFVTEAGTLEVLKGIDLRIQKGEFIAITGASGAGKSTLLHIMGTIDRPSSGTVLYDETDVFRFDDNKLSLFRNNHIGFIFQFHHLLPEFSALENTLLPGLISGIDRVQLIERASALLKDLGIYERKEHRPGELSGGEQQRVAVARALILSPDIVLADEPTGNLDTVTGEDLFGILKNLNQEKGITIVMVTHNDSLAERCDRILHIKDGALSEVR
ncbi:MAG: ABC transporter ATP-binding protein [Thermoplasmata archaeon M9B2D]|nr:MAG: ABC transporter ATP-binding protein [Thermoplasmata archaeon M9B2D]